MSHDVDGWYRIAAVLPDAEAQEVRACWEIGEQEAGLGLLVSDREPWGDLSCLARHYIITAPARGTVLRMFPADAASKAFAALLEECPA